MGARGLVWFRSDLRTTDNTALLEACRDAREPVVGLFLVTPRQWREHGWGSPKVDFVLRGVRPLSAELERLAIPLIVREAASFRGAPQAVLEVAREHAVTRCSTTASPRSTSWRRDERSRPC